jgi:hypothetical protein
MIRPLDGLTSSRAIRQIGMIFHLFGISRLSPGRRQKSHCKCLPINILRR